MIHCIHCGHQLSGDDWPRQCGGCQAFNYNSPKPVVALVLRSWCPKTGHPGIIAIQRGIEPHKGEWAFPGGYIDFCEDWRMAAARETREEIGVVIDPEQLCILDAVVTPTNFLVFFVGLTIYIPKNAWAEFDPTSSEALNDTGEQEILDIEVFPANVRRPLGIPSHNTFWQNFRF